MTVLKQKTLKKTVSLSGLGLFTGSHAQLCIHPAKENSGLIFKRVDLKGSSLIPASLDSVVDSSRCTTLGVLGATVQTVEHLLAALAACGIDNALIEIDGPEVPICDGSALIFINLIKEAGTQELPAEKVVLNLEKPLFWSKGQIHLVALPNDCPQFSYTLHYPQSKFLGSQYYSFNLSEDHFIQEIAQARTFALKEEVDFMLAKGLLRGASLENGVIIAENGVLNPEGTRFDNEMVRHKILDMIGDFALLEGQLNAHIIGICSGHASHTTFGKEIRKNLKTL